jgi:protein SCO1/2
MSVLRRSIIVLLCCACILLAVWYFMQTKYNKPTPVVENATVMQPRKQLEAFNLFDADGNLFDLNSLRGHWNLVFFGYTTCPDICPQTLGTIRDTWSLYSPPSKPPVRFIFASITPITKGDTVLREFLSNYNPEFIGIGGSDNDIKQLSDQLGIYANQLPDKIDHTAALMLIDPQGRLTAVLTPPFYPAILAHDLNVLTGS